MAWRGDPKKVADLIVGTTQSVGDSEAVGGSAISLFRGQSAVFHQRRASAKAPTCGARVAHFTRRTPACLEDHFSNLLDVNHADSFQTGAARTSHEVDLEYSIFWQQKSDERE